MKAPAIETALIDALRELPVGTKPRQSALRSAIGCSTAELSACIQSMRFKGKLHWERLELSGSLLVEAEEYQGASGTARKASGGSSSDESTRITDRVPFEREQASAVPATPAPDLSLPEQPTGAETDVLQFSERVVLHKGRLAPEGSTATAYAWLVWRKDLEDAQWSALSWIAPCRRRLERAGDYPLEVAA